MHIFPELGVAGPVPGVLDRPAVPNVLDQSLGAGAQTRDLTTGLVDGLAKAGAFAAHRQDRGATRLVFHHPLWGGHAPQRPGEVSAAFTFTVAGLPRRLAAIGQADLDHLGKLAATLFHRISLRGRLASKGRRRPAARGKGKRAICMQRVGLYQQAVEINAIHQLAQGRDLAAGIGGVGVLGNRHAKGSGVEAHLGDKPRYAGSGSVD